MVIRHKFTEDLSFKIEFKYFLAIIVPFSHNIYFGYALKIRRLFV